MLSLRKPTADSMRRFLAVQSELPFTYEPVGATAETPPAGYVVDRTHQVDEVVGGVDALQGLIQRTGVENVALDDLPPVIPITAHDEISGTPTSPPAMLPTKNAPAGRALRRLPSQE